jgi:hypothetical protein
VAADRDPWCGDTADLDAVRALLVGIAGPWFEVALEGILFVCHARLRLPMRRTDRLHLLLPGKHVGNRTFVACNPGFVQ